MISIIPDFFYFWIIIFFIIFIIIRGFIIIAFFKSDTVAETVSIAISISIGGFLWIVIIFIFRPWIKGICAIMVIGITIVFAIPCSNIIAAIKAIDILIQKGLVLPRGGSVIGYFSYIVGTNTVIVLMCRITVVVMIPIRAIMSSFFIRSAGVGGGGGGEAQKQQEKEGDKLSHEFLLSEINENDIVYASDAPFFVLTAYFSCSKRTDMRSVILALSISSNFI